MKVILTKNVEKLGVEGQVVEVSDGYARNYLFSRELAVYASAAALKTLSEKQKIVAAKQEQLAGKAQLEAKKLGSSVLRISVKASEDGKLFGSVSEKKIAERIDKEYKINIAPEDIIISEPIKKLGKYAITVKLAKDIQAVLKVLVENPTE